MNLKHAFFKSARFTPTLICYGDEECNLYEANEEIDGTPYGNYFCSGGKVFRFAPQSRKLEDFDRDYIRSSGLETMLKQEVEKIYERRKQTKQELDKELEILRSRKVLSFIENYVFKLMREEASTSPIKENNHSNGEDEIAEKLKQQLKDNRLNILGKFFEKGIYLIFGPIVYVLEETSSPEEMHVRFSSADYNMRPLCDLEALETLYEKSFEEAVTKEATIADRRLSGMRSTIENIKELKKDTYREGDFGFRKIDGTYYFTIMVPPHCYIDGKTYYLFEPVEIGARIPVSGKEVGEITLSSSQPVEFGTSYKHPALNPKKVGKIRAVCYKGGGSSTKDVSNEIDAEVARKAAKTDDKLEVKAFKLKLILEKLGVALMAEAYSKDGSPHVLLSPRHFPAKTEADYHAWLKKKKAKGHKDIFKNEI